MKVALLLASLAASGVCAVPLLDQLFFKSPPASDSNQWTTFKTPIRTVAVIGAGPSGLQAAATLISEGFEVRLFERADGPGGNWYHNTLTPTRESYPNKPALQAGYTPDARDEQTQFFKDGDDGLTLDARWREHIRPSPLWDSLHTNSPPVITSLPDISYPRDAPWALPGTLVTRVVRAFASSKGLNANDARLNASDVPQVSYSTRVELLQKSKAGNSWILSLRRLERLPHSAEIKAEWWREDFDAVVVATGEYDAAFVPNIKGLPQWSEVKSSDGSFPVAHSQSYRNPELFEGKTVLIIGASVSASEISRDVGPHVQKLYISLRNTSRSTYMARRSIRRLYPDAEIIPEIVEFGALESQDSIHGGLLKLSNGSFIGGIDKVVLSTGFLRSNPFLRDYAGTAKRGKNSHPILTPDGHGLSSLSWSGHYIPDPTLAFTTVRPWTLGRYQSLSFAKVWKGTARLPNQATLWKDYFDDNHWQGVRFSGPVFATIGEESLARQYIAWLNAESLIFGGRFVDQWPIEYREVFSYYSDQAWEHGYVSHENFTRYENTPRSEWPVFPREPAATALESGSEW